MTLTNVDYWFLGHRKNPAPGERPLLHLSGADASAKPGAKAAPRANPRKSRNPRVRRGWVS